MQDTVLEELITKESLKQFEKSLIKKMFYLFLLQNLVLGSLFFLWAKGII
jgi:hypothetical protein